MRNLCGLLIVITSIATPAAAQIPSAIQRGDRIGIMIGGSQQWIDGRLTRVSSDSIYLERCDNCRPEAFALAGLSSLRVRREHRPTNAILGAVAGGAIAYIGCASGRCTSYGATTHQDRRGIVIPAVALLGGFLGFRGAAPGWTEINLHPDSGTRAPVLTVIKEPAVAVMWGIAVPGGGQMYADNWPKGILIFAGTAGLTYAAFSIAFSNICENCHHDDTKADAVLATAAALWVYGFASAPHDAMRYNAEHQPRFADRISVDIGRSPGG